MSGDDQFYTWLKEVRCTTVKEAAARLGIAWKSAHDRLKRLERRGVLVRRMVGRVAVYCVREGAQLPPPPLPSKPTGPGEKTRRKMEKASELVARDGCVAASALRRRLNLSHSQMRHVMYQLLAEGRVVEVVVGKVALWCRDRAAAEDVVKRLKDIVHRLVTANGLRYISPSRVLRLAQPDREAYPLFSRFVPLSRFPDDHLHPVALAFADSILASLYGEPVVNMPNRHVYFVAQPRQDIGDIVIRDKAEKVLVNVNLSDGLAAALKDTDAEEVVMRAIERLLARYRT
jgi:ribosomal protein S25